MSDAFIICLLIELIVAAIAVRHIYLLKKGIKIRDQLLDLRQQRIDLLEEVVENKKEIIEIYKKITK